MSAAGTRVFINCPFDEDYRPLFEAIIFTLHICGHVPCCALEQDDFGDVRLDKLKSLIEGCDLTIHDLSRTQSSDANLPRFNMPFELGLTIGARSFGGSRQRRKRVLCMVEEKYAMPKFLSDAAGNDPHAHGNDPAEVVKIVRNWLNMARPPGKKLAGPKAINRLFDKFRQDTPRIIEEMQLASDEIHPFRGHYNDFLAALQEWTDATLPKLIS